MNRPQPRRQRPQLDALDAAALDEGDGVLDVVVRVLGEVGREVSSGRHRLAVHRLDYPKLVGADPDPKWRRLRARARDAAGDHVGAQQDLDHACELGDADACQPKPHTP